MHVCCLCQHVGIHQPEHSWVTVPVVVCIHSTETNPLTVKRQQRSFCHPRCYIAKMGIAKLLTLHADELGSIRLGDASPRAVKSILAELIRRGELNHDR